MKIKYSLVLTLISLWVVIVFAQPKWTYRYQINFPPSDTAFVRPYLCSVDENGRLYVISSKIVDTRARNAIWYCDPDDRVMKKLIDYDLNGDSDTLTGNLYVLRGIATLRRDVIINGSVPFPRSRPNTVASQYYYKNGDTTQVEKFGFYHTGSGYGTYINGLAVSKDSFAFTGISYQSSVRLYNFTRSITTPARGSYVPPPTYGQEPGGHDGTGLSTIRDVAVRPNGDYNNTETPWYTSRNSNPPISGGITVWVGGTQASPGTYTGQRVIDPYSYLSFDRSVPYGITVDNQNRLWVAGTDSTRRWVKAFELTGTFAMDVAELPSQNSSTNPDPNGAPMIAPADVALNSAGNVAYVTDIVNRCVYKFEFGDFTSVDEKKNTPTDFKLEQNFPNPFNPSTLIAFSLPEAMNVKLVVRNSLGQEVATLVDEYLPAGKHVRTFSAQNLVSGIYYYTLITPNGSISKKMILAK
ncbi:MAG: T9SS type A sorting domain-containing protein [Ignavibacteria bacterium]|nr:T9SS type A sorting domain-containing protein [Ignavibacteria bacterium]